LDKIFQVLIVHPKVENQKYFRKYRQIDVKKDERTHNQKTRGHPVQTSQHPLSDVHSHSPRLAFIKDQVAKCHAPTRADLIRLKWPGISGRDVTWKWYMVSTYYTYMNYCGCDMM